jgi:hypothetical protein
MNKERESNKVDSLVSEVRSDAIELDSTCAQKDEVASENISTDRDINSPKTSLSQTSCLPVNTQYSVSIWEIILIFLGAISLFGAGLLGLIVKSYVNKYDPSRAEIIARSLIDYQIPGGSQGVASSNIGAEKFAVVKSISNPSQLILSVSTTPIDLAAEDIELFPTEAVSILDNTDGKFAAEISYQEDRAFCGQKRSVTVEEGQHISIDNSKSPPAVKYVVKTTEDNIEYAVNVLAIGNDAKQQAGKLLSSLECKF